MLQKSNSAKSAATLSISLGLLLAAVVTSPAADNNKEQVAAIEAAIEQYAEAYKSGDGAKVADFFTDDVVYMADGQPTVNGQGFKSLIAANVEASKSQFEVDLEILVEKVEVFGKIAYDRGSYTASLTPKAGGEPLVFELRYLTIWKQAVDGKWRIWQAINNSEGAHTWPPPALTSNH
jgi:uncharacterized protein (TIGR02246 family)